METTAEKLQAKVVLPLTKEEIKELVDRINYKYALAVKRQEDSEDY